MFLHCVILWPWPLRLWPFDPILFGDLSISISAVLVLSCRQTDRQTESNTHNERDADDRLTHATIVSMTNYFDYFQLDCSSGHCDCKHFLCTKICDDRDVKVMLWERWTRLSWASWYSTFSKFVERIDVLLTCKYCWMATCKSRTLYFSFLPFPRRLTKFYNICNVNTDNACE